jgi:pentatricopeptide repeat protein
MSEVDQKDASSWACEPVYYNPLLENWRTVTPNRVHSGIILPRMLLRKLFELSRFNPNFRFNLDTLEIIMDGAIKQARPRRGPIRVEGLVDDILLEATVSYRDIQPYIRIWNKLMDAWSKNNMNFAPKRMWLLLRTMRNKGLQPNTDTYATFLSYWNRRGRPSEMHQICDEMMRENIPMNAKCLSYLFNVHLKCGKTEDAEDVLWQMLDLKPQGDDHCQAIRKCAFKLFHVYKNSRLLDSSNEETASVSLKAENAFRHVENWVALNDRDKST